MVYEAVLVFFGHHRIRHEVVGIDCAASGNVVLNFLLENLPATSRNDVDTDFPAALQNAHHSGFIFCASLGDPATMCIVVHEASGTAYESFVYFHFGAGTTEL